VVPEKLGLNYRLGSSVLSGLKVLVVVPDKPCLKLGSFIHAIRLVHRLSGGSRKTRIETPPISKIAGAGFESKWWFQKNKD
jgi:hypothetical protein